MREVQEQTVEIIKSVVDTFRIPLLLYTTDVGEGCRFMYLLSTGT